MMHRPLAAVACFASLIMPAIAVVGSGDGADPMVAGDTLLVAGYGIAVRADGRTGGTVRSATLVDNGRPGTFEMRLDDPERSRARVAKGVCTGESGAPVFVEQTRQFAMIGVVSWS